MNNQAFRNLLLSNSTRKDGSTPTPPTTRPSATPALGSRKTSSIPMTPRQVSGRSNLNDEFARQLAERNGKAAPTRKFKSHAPKGVKLVAGYTDRARDRLEKEKKEAEEAEDETEQRIKKLEESMKLGLMDRVTFEALVQEITDGDISRTHLVKGLDRKLLERVRKGEDVRAVLPKEEAEGETADVEEEFEELAEHEFAPVVREKTEKKGEMAPPPIQVAGVKRSRDAILAELKAQRKAAAEAAEAERLKKYPTLGPGFRRVGANGETSRLETDNKGREILIVTKADGTEKRKIRKQKAEESKPEAERKYLEDPNKPLNINMESMPVPKKEEEESEDEDIFAGVGSNYNPLADLKGSDDSSDDEEKEEGEETSTIPAEPAPILLEDKIEEEEDDTNPSTETPPPPTAPLPRRNYFADTPTPQPASQPSSADATVRAALLKARNLDASSSLLANTEEARLRKRADELAAQDRDMEDLDMGFGASRFDDADEMEREGEKVKFSEWRGLGGEGDDEEEEGGRGAKKRKRGGKKRKGDKNSAADVLDVMERQKGAKPLG